MVHTSRRRLLAVAGLAAVAGCVSDDEEPSDPVPEVDDESLLGMVPPAVEGVELAELLHLDPVEKPDAPMRGQFLYDIPSEIELDTDEIDEIAVAFYIDEPTDEDDAENEALRGGWLISGSFDADDPVVDDEMEAEAAIDREDGLFIATFNETNGETEPGEAVSAAIEATRDGARTPVVETDEVSPAFEHLDEPVMTTVSVQPRLEGMVFGVGRADITDIDGIQSLVSGTTTVDDQQIDTTVVAGFSSESDADEEAFEEHIEERVRADIDPDVEQDGQFVRAQYTREIEPRPDHDAGPDVRMVVRYREEDGVATVRHRGGDSVPADELHLSIDGEPVELDWGTDTVEEDDTAELSVDPFAAYRLEWRDPDDEATFDTLTTGVLYDPTAFESHYDDDEETVSFSYDGRPIDRTDRLELRYQPDGDRQAGTTETVDERTNQLEAGDELVVEDVQYGDSVTLSASYEFEQRSGRASIIIHQVEPPGRFRVDHDEPTLEYTDDESHDAAEFTVTIDDNLAATQFEDDHDTLEAGDELVLDAEPGDRVSVDWEGDEETHNRLEVIVQPPAAFDLARVGDEYEVTYVSEEPWPADAFELEVPDDTIEQQFADAYDQLEAGDSVPVDLADQRDVTVLYVGGPEPVQLTWLTPRAAAEFDLQHDDGTATLEFVSDGKWPADDFEVIVNDDSIGTPFASAHTTVEKGDAVTVDADLGDRVTVVTETAQRELPVYRETVQPALEIETEQVEDGIALTTVGSAEVDADRLSVVKRAPRQQQEEFDPWGDTGVVEPGTTVTVDVELDRREILAVRFDEHTLTTVRSDDLDD